MLLKGEKLPEAFQHVKIEKMETSADNRDKVPNQEFLESIVGGFLRPSESGEYSSDVGAVDTERSLEGSRRESSRKITKQKLMEHELLRLMKRPYKCESCSKSFVSKMQLAHHQKEGHPGVKLYKCKTCGKSFMTLPGLARHEGTHFL